MTDQQALDTYNQMVEHFGGSLPDFEHCPKEFAYYVKLYTYTKNANPGAYDAPQANS